MDGLMDSNNTYTSLAYYSALAATRRCARNNLYVHVHYQVHGYRFITKCPLTHYDDANICLSTTHRKS